MKNPYFHFLILMALLVFSPGGAGAVDWRIGVGDPLPGQLVDLLEERILRGGEPPAAMLINFTDCRSENCLPLIKELRDFVAVPLADMDVRVVAIGAGLDDGGAREAMEVHRTGFPILPDRDGALLALVATPVVPLTLIVDRTGHVVYRHSGYRPGREAEFRYVLETVHAGDELPPNLAGGEKMLQVADGELVGTPAPEVHTPHWITPASGSREGKHLLVTFWATWCGPCISSKNIAEPLYGRFRERLYSVSISGEDADLVEEFVAARGWKQAIAVDPEDRTRRAIGFNSFPSAFLADPDGIIIWHGHPGVLWMNNAEILERLLGE